MGIFVTLRTGTVTDSAPRNWERKAREFAASLAN